MSGIGSSAFAGSVLSGTLPFRLEVFVETAAAFALDPANRLTGEK